MTFPHTATLRRLSKVGSKYTYANGATLECFVQPIDSVTAQAYGIVFTKASACYMPIGTDVNVGDALVVDGITYGVRGKRVHNYGSLQHIYLVLEQSQ